MPATKVPCCCFPFIGRLFILLFCLCGKCYVVITCWNDGHYKPRCLWKIFACELASIPALVGNILQELLRAGSRFFFHSAERRGLMEWMAGNARLMTRRWGVIWPSRQSTKRSTFFVSVAARNAIHFLDSPSPPVADHQAPLSLDVIWWASFLMFVWWMTPVPFFRFISQRRAIWLAFCYDGLHHDLSFYFLFLDKVMTCTYTSRFSSKGRRGRRRHWIYVQKKNRKSTCFRSFSFLSQNNVWWAVEKQMDAKLQCKIVFKWKLIGFVWYLKKEKENKNETWLVEGAECNEEENKIYKAWKKEVNNF